MTSDPNIGRAADDTTRRGLDSEADHLRGQLRELDRDESSLDFDENFADSAQVAAEQGENQALASQLREQLDDIEHALSRLDDGSYGTCEVCGAAIADARLQAMPATRFCIDHAG